MHRKGLAVGIVFLFIVSTVTPVVTSYDEPEEKDEGICRNCQSSMIDSDIL